MLQTCGILLSKPIGATGNHQPLCLARFRSQHWRQSTCGFHYWEMQCPIVWLDGIISWTQEFEYINFSLLEATNSIHFGSRRTHCSCLPLSHKNGLRKMTAQVKGIRIVATSSMPWCLHCQPNDGDHPDHPGSADSQSWTLHESQEQRTTVQGGMLGRPNVQ